MTRLSDKMIQDLIDDARLQEHLSRAISYPPNEKIECAVASIASSNLVIAELLQQILDELKEAPT